jgi:hypothetical protein
MHDASMLEKENAMYEAVLRLMGEKKRAGGISADDVRLQTARSCLSATPFTLTSWVPCVQ